MAGLLAAVQPPPTWAEARQPDPRRPAPDCVIADLDDGGFTDELTVTNNCASPKWIKVILANIPDEPCDYIPGNGGSSDFTWDWPGRFDRLEVCPVDE